MYQQFKAYLISHVRTLQTTGTLITAILALVLHPEVVQRAHAQLDAVIGCDRLPTLDDQAQLPYIDAIVKEVMRWRPSGPIGIPRRATQVISLTALRAAN